MAASNPSGLLKSEYLLTSECLTQGHSIVEKLYFRFFRQRWNSFQWVLARSTNSLDSARGFEGFYSDAEAKSAIDAAMKRRRTRPQAGRACRSRSARGARGEGVAKKVARNTWRRSGVGDLNQACFTTVVADPSAGLICLQSLDVPWHCVARWVNDCPSIG